MKVVILAGGFGTRIAEESHLRPKPMIEIGHRPILWHIMKIYSTQGFNDFVICAGYKQHAIKEYFDDYFLHSSDITFDYRDGCKSVEVHGTNAEAWRVTVADTGYSTMTGGRVKRVQPYIGDERFLLTYGDGVSDVDIAASIDCHEKLGTVVTIAGVPLAQTKGVLEVGQDGHIRSFREKQDQDGAIINGGYMVCEPQLFDYLEDDTTILEQVPMTRLASEGKLGCYRHTGFWKCMDTQREREQLEALWSSGNAPWKIW